MKSPSTRSLLSSTAERCDGTTGSKPEKPTIQPLDMSNPQDWMFSFSLKALIGAKLFGLWISQLYRFIGSPRSKQTCCSSTSPTAHSHSQRGFHNPRFDEEAAAEQDREVAEKVIQFWFEELTIDDWFRQSHILDDRIRKEFGALHARAAGGELAGWAHEKDTCLALVVILDQFSRNLYRGSNSAYSCDAAARAAANMAIMRGDDKTWQPGPKRWALYLPFMHSDDLQDKARCVNLMREGTMGRNPRGTSPKEALPRLQATLSGTGHERKSKAGPKASASASNMEKAGRCRRRPIQARCAAKAFYAFT
eukprot:symbB.v1.2.036487.t1/scaffold5163.1/size31484/1